MENPKKTIKTGINRYWSMSDVAIDTNQSYRVKMPFYYNISYLAKKPLSGRLQLVINQDAERFRRSACMIGRKQTGSNWILLYCFNCLWLILL